MANYQNHVVDPTYFYDAIEQFAFDFDIYVKIGEELDELGRQHNSYEMHTIRGSLQSQGKKKQKNKSGSTDQWVYNFYCKSLFRIDIGDVIHYKDRWLMVQGIQDYDEYGVRSAELVMIQLTAYRDLAAYVKYIEGQEIV